jgi:hypothetical protein
MLDYASVKGRVAPVRLFTPAADADVPDIALFSQAQALYLDGKFAEAQHAFASQNGKTAAFFAARCAELVRSEKAWPGYFVWGVK